MADLLGKNLKKFFRYHTTLVGIHATITFAFPTQIRRALVLGSTSRVAKAICRELPQRGCRHFHLVARNGQASQWLVFPLKWYSG